MSMTKYLPVCLALGLIPPGFAEKNGSLQTNTESSKTCRIHCDRADWERLNAPSGEGISWRWLIKPKFKTIGGLKSPPQYGYKGFNQAGYAQAKTKSGMWAVINRQGEFVLKPKRFNRYPPELGDYGIWLQNLSGDFLYTKMDGSPIKKDYYYKPTPFFKQNNGRAWASRNRQLHLLDKDLNSLFSAASAEHGPISEGISHYTVNKRCHYIDLNGKVLTQAELKYCRPFKHGFGRAKTPEGKRVFINKQGNIISPQTAAKLLAAKQALMVKDDGKMANAEFYLLLRRGSKRLDIDYKYTDLKELVEQNIAVLRSYGKKSKQAYASWDGRIFTVGEGKIPKRLISADRFYTSKEKQGEQSLEGVSDRFGKVWIKPQFDDIPFITEYTSETGKPEILVAVRQNGLFGYILLIQEDIDKTGSSSAQAITRQAAIKSADNSKFLNNNNNDGLDRFVQQLKQKADKDLKSWQQKKSPKGFESALFNIESALQINPKDDELWLFKAQLLSQMTGSREYQQQGLQAALKAISINQKNWQAQLLLAQVEFNLGMFEHSIRQIDYIIEQQQQLASVRLLSLLMSAYIANGQAEDAELYLREKIFLNQEQTQTKFNFQVVLAVLLHHMQQTTEALELLTTLQATPELHPDQKGYLQALSKKWQGGGA